MSIEIGAHYLGNGNCEFCVWAPNAKEVMVKQISPEARLIPMECDQWSYWRVKAEDVWPGAQYFYLIGEAEGRPDPASQLQSLGVHGPSTVIDHNDFTWTDQDWKGTPQERLVIYELHVGTFTSEGTFDAILPRLSELRELGITAIELMPIAEFPGNRNWGYDGVYPFAVHHAYGGPDGLKRLVDNCHRAGLSVILDVVYNHLGPEGNYLSCFAPYFTDSRRTPWGSAINFDDAGSDGVRHYFIENARCWFDRYHIDGLRLDAIHEIHDQNARPFLQELSERTSEISARQGRPLFLFAESNRNDPRAVRPKDAGGLGLSGLWCDDFHHSLRSLLTDERRGYYADYGGVADLVKSISEGFVYTGEYSLHRRRRHGASSADRPGHEFVVFTLNHDQIGNRMFGERLPALIPFDALKLAAGAVLLSPYLPLLFMGEEYAEQSPFLYFVSHGDADLIQAVRRGRKEEFKAFEWIGEPPDPQSEETFLRSKLNWEKRREGRHSVMREFYRRLLRLRREIPALAALDKNKLDAFGSEESRIVFLHRWTSTSQVFCLMNFDREPAVFTAPPSGVWNKLLDSAETEWAGRGSFLPGKIERRQTLKIRGLSFALYELEQAS